MDRATREALHAINRDFYEKHATPFDATRDHPWPGWERVLAALPHDARSILDAGCGNGRFARFLHTRDRPQLQYTGIDSSPALLRAARERAQPDSDSFVFQAGDLEQDRDLPAGPFDAIVLFGVLHHVAGFDERVQLVARLASRLAEGGVLAATLWRFGSDPRVVGRTVEFDAPDLGALEAGDHLLRWGDATDDDEIVVRYCHFVDDAEVERLIACTREAGLVVSDRFRSDGRSGELNEYLVWSHA